MLRKAAYFLLLLVALCLPSQRTSKHSGVLKVAYIHTNMHPGGVETHILNLCSGLQEYYSLSSIPVRVEPHVFLYRNKNGQWGRMLPALLATGTAVHRKSIATLTAQNLNKVNQSGFHSLVEQLRGFDVAMTFYGGGKDRQIGVEAAQLAGEYMLALSYG